MERNTPVPREVQLAIEAARNNVTTLNAEVSRLSKLAFNYEESVRKLHTEKEELHSMVETLTKTSDSLSEAISLKEKQLAQTSNRVVEAEKEAHRIEQQSTTTEELCRKMHADLDARTLQHERLERDISDRSKVLDTRAEELGNKYRALKDFGASLS